MKKLITILLIIIVLSGIITITKINSQKRIKKYETGFWATVSAIAYNADTIMQYGQTAKLLKRMKFNAADETVRIIETNHRLIKENMIMLKKYPKQYKEAYELLMELYTSYDLIYTYYQLEESASPLLLYSIVEKVEKVRGIISKLEILMPVPQIAVSHEQAQQVKRTK